MRRISMLAAVALLAACGGQDISDPCVYRLNVFDPVPASAQVGIAVPVDLELTVRSGTCSVPTNANVSWSVSNTNVAEILSQTNTTASVRGLKAGSVFVTAWLALAPEVRDSTTFTVTAPVDN